MVILICDVKIFYVQPSDTDAVALARSMGLVRIELRKMGRN